MLPIPPNDPMMQGQMPQMGTPPGPEMGGDPMGGAMMPPGVPPGGPQDPLAAFDQMMGYQNPMDAMHQPEGIPGAGFPGLSPDGPPIQLQGEDLDRFTVRFQSFLENSIGAMSHVHARAKRHRRVFRMSARKQEYDGQPNLTTPLTANKTDGVVSFIQDAVDVTPVVFARPRGIGKAAEEASEVAHLYEAYLEREVDLSGSRDVITIKSIQEAGVTGTCGLILEMAEHDTGELFAQMRVIPLEDLFFDDVTDDNLDTGSVAYRRRYRMYELDDMANLGYIDREAFENLRVYINDREAAKKVTETENKVSIDQIITTYDTDMGVRTLFVGYMRYKPVGEPKAVLYQTLYHRSSRRMLMLRKAPYRDAYDAPNVDIVRFGEFDGVLGRGIPERLAPLQEMADNGINSHIAQNNLRANPPYYVREGSPFEKWVERNQRFGIRGNVGIKTRDPERPDVKAIELPGSGLNIQDVEIAMNMASQATFTEEAIGAPTQGRRTLGQFQIEVDKGTVKLRKDLRILSYDWMRVLKKYWAMVVAYKIVPSGVVEIDKDGKLLAARELPMNDVRQTITDSLLPMLAQGEIQPHEYEMVDQEIGDLLTGGAIPSAVRSDIIIGLAGARIVADRLAQIELEREFMNIVLTPGILDAAAQSDYVNYAIRSYGVTQGLKDMDRRLPPPPGGEFMDPGQRDQALQTFSNMSQSQSIR